MNSTDRLPLAILLLTVSVYLFLQYDQGWIAHDEGLLGQSAARVLEGQLPHIEFDDPYTGGLAILHAGAMSVFGVSSLSLRILLLGFTISATLVTYLLLRRITTPWVAFLIAWLSLAWGVPNYFAGLPSWYNLFFALFGTWALLKFTETDARRWLFIAGWMGGLSFLIKLSGLYFIAAGLLYLVHREQNEVCAEESKAIRSRWYDHFVTTCLVCFIAALVLLVRRRFSAMDAIHFVLPGAALSTFLIINQYRTSQGRSWLRFQRLTIGATWFLAGVAIPIAAFLMVYASRSGLAVWINGVFILPQKRMEFADYSLPGITSLWAMLPLGSLLVLPKLFRRHCDPLWLAGIGWIACVFVLVVAWQSPLYEAIWMSIRSLSPVTTVIGCIVLWKNPLHPHNRILFLLMAVTSMVSLVQFPYSSPIYFCYTTAPLLVSYATLLLCYQQAPRHLSLIAAVFYLAFGVLILNQSRVQRMGVMYVADDQNTVLDLPRSGLRVSDSTAKLYSDVIKEIERHSEPGEAIYAAMDCPEIHFLADRRNPSRSFYEFFEDDFTADANIRAQRIGKMLEQNEVHVVVLHWQGEFSGGISNELAQLLVSRYPNATHFVRNPGEEPTFSVAWREQSR